MAATVLIGSATVAPAQAADPDERALDAPATPSAVAADPGRPSLPAELDRVEVLPPVTGGAPADDVETVGAVVEGEDGSPEVVTVDAPAGRVDEVAAGLADRADVVAVSIDVPVTAFDHAGDAYRQYQWGLDVLEMDLLPAVSGAGGLQVAVVDTGVLAGHPELAGRVRCDLGRSFTADETTYDPADNGCVDPDGHGTHVAGIVAAVGDNGAGIEGLSAAQIIPVRVLDASGSGSSSDIAAGVIHAVDVGAEVINLSLGGTQRTAVLEAAVQYALDSGVIVVAAAGNNRETENLPNYPAALPGVIAVAAAEHAGASATYSYSGPTNTVTAPGSDVISTFPGGYAVGKGTSMAAPHVAGVLVRYRALHPDDTVDAVVAAVETTADDMELDGFDDNTGHGMLDAYQLLTGIELPPDPSWTVPGSPPITGEVLGNGAVTVRWNAPANGGRPITGYVVEAFDPSDFSSVGVVEVGSGARAATVRGLAKGKTYYFGVWAANAVGYGDPAWTEATVPRVPSPPAVTALAPGNTTVRVRWSAPASNGGAPVTGYILRAYRGTALVRTLATAPGARELLVGGLGNGVGYTFSVTASNVAGAGRTSARSAVAVPRTVPSAPGIGTVSAGRSSATVRWAAPARTGGAAINAYLVRVYRGTALVKTVPVGANARAATVTGLAPGVAFRLAVAARNIAGVGPASALSARVVPRR